ncbi:unnamed protein product [Lathyrus oleraceus]
MDPNHFHYQQAFFNYMQNYQNPNPQNSQIPPFHHFLLKSHHFLLKLVLKKKKGLSLKKDLESNLQGKRIYYLSNHGSMFQRI